MKSSLLLVLAALPSLTTWSKGDSTHSSIPAPKPEEVATASAASGSLEAQVQIIFDQKCSQCHGESRRKPALHARVNLRSLSASEIIEPGEPARSLLMQRVKLPTDDDAHMPPSDEPQLSAQEIGTLEKWIAGNSVEDQPRQFISVGSSLEWIYKDLMAQPEPHRENLRYIQLTNLYNAKLADGRNADNDVQLDMYRAAVSKLLNSLSWQSKISVPVAIDEARTLYRIDIRDYGWDKALWETIVSYYPYGISGVSAHLENNIRKESHSNRAYVRADWLVFATSQEPLYHTILGLPETEFGPDGLEAKLGLDTMRNVREHKAVRAAFSPSGVSRTNRLVERHNIRDGGYWKSYDFKRVNAGDAQDIVLAPLGPTEANLTVNPDSVFVHDGGEIIFNLPNGMQAYYLSTAAGDFLSTAPPEVVEDRSGFRRTNIILNGISCIACHANGLNAPPKQTVEAIHDDLGRAALEHLGPADRKVVERLYVSSPELQRLANQDHARFQKANAESMPGYTHSDEPVSALYRRFNDDQLPAAQFASEFSTTDQDLLKILRQSDDKLLYVYAGKLEKGLPFSREEFLQNFTMIANELGFTVDPAQPLFAAEFGVGTVGKVAPRLKAFQTRAKPGELAVARFGDGTKVTLKMSSLTYTVGDDLAFSVHAEKRCHIRVTQFGADGSATQLLPNAHDQAVVLQPDEVRHFPAAAIFETAPPEGLESILIEACTEPLASRGEPQTGQIFTPVQRDRIFSRRGRVNVKPTTSKKVTSHESLPVPDSASAYASYELLP
jgi:mono/diheme cytochrome c family protein